MRRIRRLFTFMAVIGLLVPWLVMLGLMAGRAGVLAAGTITIDSQFADWTGQAAVADPVGDCHKSNLDIVTFSFATNPNHTTAFFMVKRQDSKNGPVGYILTVDTNNDGDYSDSGDRMVHVRYDPTSSGSKVDLSLSNGAGQSLGTLASNMDWGESLAEGGLRVEWPVTLAQLGIAAGQPIRMVLMSRPGNSNQSGSICDVVGEVQWSPADALGYPLAALLVGGAALAALHQHRRQQPCPTD